MTAEDFVSIKQLAADMGMDRSHARRYVQRIGLTPHQRRTRDSQNQKTLGLTVAEAEIVRKRRSEDGFTPTRGSADCGPPVFDDSGDFYVVRLVPELDPRRVKLGFTGCLDARIRQHRTAAPTASLVKAWPAKAAWEVVVMAALTTVAGCRLIAGEVFECDDLDAMIERGNALFLLLPDIATKTPLADVSPHNT